MTLGLEVLVQLVIAAITTEPLASFAFFFEVISTFTDFEKSARDLPKPFSVTGRW